MSERENLQEELLQIQDELIKHKKQIAASSILEEFPEKERAVQYNEELIDIIIASLVPNSTIDIEATEKVAHAIGIMSQDLNQTLDQSIRNIQEIRQFSWKKIEDHLLSLGISAMAILRFSEKFNVIFNHFHHYFCKAFIDSYEESLRRAEREFLLLSAPVVPLLDGVAIIPFVGSIDEQRAELLMQKALNDATNYELNDLFIDLSGVTIIDTNVAYHIFNIVEALEVIGVNVVLIGIRPETSQTMVSLGVSFEDVKTYHSLQQALVREKIINH